MLFGLEVAEVLMFLIVGFESMVFRLEADDSEFAELRGINVLNHEFIIYVLKFEVGEYEFSGVLIFLIGFFGINVLESCTCGRCAHIDII